MQYVQILGDGLTDGKEDDHGGKAQGKFRRVVVGTVALEHQIRAKGQNQHAKGDDQRLIFLEQLGQFFPILADHHADKEKDKEPNGVAHLEDGQNLEIRKIPPAVYENQANEHNQGREFLGFCGWFSLIRPEENGEAIA